MMVSYFSWARMLWHVRGAMRSMESSVTRLGDFWKFVAIKFLTKVAQIIGNFLGYFENHHSYLKTADANFWATFGNIWATFYSNWWRALFQGMFLLTFSTNRPQLLLQKFTSPVSCIKCRYNLSHLSQLSPIVQTLQNDELF